MVENLWLSVLLAVIAMLWILHSAELQLFPNARLGCGVSVPVLFLAAFVRSGRHCVFKTERSEYGYTAEPAAEDAPAESVTGIGRGRARRREKELGK